MYGEFQPHGFCLVRRPNGAMYLADFRKPTRAFVIGNALYERLKRRKIKIRRNYQRWKRRDPNLCRSYETEAYLAYVESITNIRLGKSAGRRLDMLVWYKTPLKVTFLSVKRMCTM